MHIQAVQSTRHQVIFATDPMHGNTKTTTSGIKTRHLQDIVVEISESFRLHNQFNSKLNGIHLEMTGEVDENGQSVTECLGGSMELPNDHLPLRYQVGYALFQVFCQINPIRNRAFVILG